MGDLEGRGENGNVLGRSKGSLVDVMIENKRGECKVLSLSYFIVIILRLGSGGEVQQRSSLSDVPSNTKEGVHRVV